MLFRAWVGVSIAAAAAVCSAWSGTGHMVAATIAERDLTPVAKAEIDRLLAAGPVKNLLEASVWADDNRSAESSPWHYINLHFRTDGKSTKMKPEAENAVVAVRRFQQILSDRTKPDDERSLALRYLLHFVADLHQPCHAVARDTDAYPTGDRGGNEFAILPPAGFESMSRPPRNLHALWDMGAGLFSFEPASDAVLRRVHVQAETLRASLPRRSFRRGRDLEPMNWAREGLDLAKRTVYRLEEGQAPSGAYMEAARAASAQRVTLAGYRLAQILNRTLK